MDGVLSYTFQHLPVSRGGSGYWTKINNTNQFIDNELIEGASRYQETALAYMGVWPCPTST